MSRHREQLPKIVQRGLFELNHGGGRGRGEVAATAGATAAPPRSLDLKDSDIIGQGKNDIVKMFMRPHRCSSRGCPRCGPAKGWETREVLLGKQDMFRNPALLTLTVDLKGTITKRGFHDEREAYTTVTQSGLIRRLMKRLGYDTWVWVLEFQKSGSPHWHILVDLNGRRRMPKEKLQEAWHLWRDQYGVGGVDIRVQNAFESRVHAINYITKYLMKPQVWPAWFLAGSRQRMVQGSRKVGRLVMAEYESSSRSLRTRRVNRVQTLDVRIAMCDQLTDVFISRVNPETFEERLEYYGQFPAKIDDVLQL